MADVHDHDLDNDKQEVRLMTYQDEVDYDDITIEEVLDEQQPKKDASSQGQGKRPDSFDRVYEDNSHRRQGSQQSFRSYGASHNPRIFSVNLGSNTSMGQSWKNRLIGILVVAAVLAFVIFVALPFVSIVVIAGAIAYMLYKFFA